MGWCNREWCLLFRSNVLFVLFSGSRFTLVDLSTGVNLIWSVEFPVMGQALLLEIVQEMTSLQDVQNVIWLNTLKLSLIPMKEFSWRTVAVHDNSFSNCQNPIRSPRIPGYWFQHSQWNFANRNTLLLLASKHWNISAVQIPLESGADPNTTAKGEDYPLLSNIRDITVCCSNKGYSSIVFVQAICAPLLSTMQHGADINGCVDEQDLLRRESIHDWGLGHRAQVNKGATQ